MDFPTRLKQLRSLKKFTQEQLGKKINVSKVSISGYENGTRTPDLGTLIKISNVLNVSIDYLLGRTDINTTAPAINKPLDFDERMLIMEKQNIYVAYLGGDKEELTKEEANRLKEELEMFRLLKAKRKQKKKT
jgi:transcriptional regulator with XRE-family HTH domain